MTDWMTTKQAADYLQVSEATIYRWARDGKLQAYRLGDSRRYRQEDLDAMAVPIRPEMPWVPPQDRSDLPVDLLSWGGNAEDWEAAIREVANEEHRYDEEAVSIALRVVCGGILNDLLREARQEIDNLSVQAADDHEREVYERIHKQVIHLLDEAACQLQ